MIVNLMSGYNNVAYNVVQDVWNYTVVKRQSPFTDEDQIKIQN